MTELIVRPPKLEDETHFLSAIQRSHSLHDPWVKPPLTSQEFKKYFRHYQLENQKSFLMFTPDNDLIGVFNLNEIVRGSFQNAYLGFYAIIDHAGKGYMSTGLKLILKKAFHELKLHRLEANIQPGNTRSINLVKNNGFRNEGFSPHYLKINNEWRDHERWAMTYEDFNQVDQIQI